MEAPPFVSRADWARMSWHQRAVVERRREVWARASLASVREARVAAEAALAAEEAALAAATTSDSVVAARAWLARVGPDPDAERHMAELMAATRPDSAARQRF